MKHKCMSRNLLRLMILMKLKRNQLKKRLKNVRGERWPKIINFFLKKRKNKRKIRKKKKLCGND